MLWPDFQLDNTMRLTLLTFLTMIAFAANSIFGRLALEASNGSTVIDPASYSTIRLVSGAIMLALIVIYANKLPLSKILSKEMSAQGNWVSALSLFAYAAAFSFAYLNLETGMGALILFSCVQATMIFWALVKGDRPSLMEWIGLLVALGTFVWLVSPGLGAPDPYAAGLMALSGIAWGVYSLRGKSAADPLRATAGNFILSVPFAIVLIVAATSNLHATAFGFSMAVASGAISSALGYSLWYQVLRSLTATQGAIVQLSVPVFAGIGGLILLGEPMTLRFSLASLLILGGIAMAILAKQKRA